MMPIEALPQPSMLAGVRVLVLDDAAACRRALDPILLSDVVAWLARDVTSNGEITAEVKRMGRLR